MSHELIFSYRIFVRTLFTETFHNSRTEGRNVRFDVLVAVTEDSCFLGHYAIQGVKRKGLQA
jgi:hypothetical protein